MPTIILEDVGLRYQSRWFLNQLSVQFQSNHFHCLLGQSGVGKSSLLKLMAGLLPLERGAITFDGTDDISQFIAWMPQSSGLLPWFDVLGNVLIASRLKPEQHTDKRLEKIKALALLDQVGLSGCENYKPHQLSGGMAQRVSLVRTLMQDKPIILMDEPFSAVDAVTRHQLQSLAKDLLKEKTVLMVTHDPLEALLLADDVWVLSGRPAQFAEHLELPTSPALREMEAGLWQKHQHLLKLLGGES